MRRLVPALLLIAVVVAGCSSSGGTKKGTSGLTGSSAPSLSGGAPITESPSGSPSSSRSAQARTAPRLTAFQVGDVSYVGSDGWALGAAKCLSGSGRCAAIEHSTDGGSSWSSLPAPVGIPVALGAEHIRFATTGIGYVFGTSTLFLTRDGGHTWRRQAGGAVALESLSGNVLRVVAGSGCPPGCTYRMQMAGVGGTSWRGVTLPGRASPGDDAQLARTGRAAYLLTAGNPAGGAQSARSVLYASRDDGVHWTNRGEPCPQSGGQEVDSRELSGASDGSVAVLCQVRMGGAAPFVAISPAGGASFAVSSRTALGSASISAFAAATSAIVFVSSDQTYRSKDGGRHFTRLGANGGSAPGQLSWLGFASATVGHGVSLDHRSICTTTDAGRTWRRHAFS